MKSLQRLLSDPSLVRWLTAVAVTLGIALLLYSVRRWRLKSFLKKTPAVGRRIAPYADSIGAATRLWFIGVAALYGGLQVLGLDTQWAELTYKVVFVLAAIQLAFWVNAAVNTTVELKIQEMTPGDGGRITLLGTLKFLGHVLTWSIILLLVLENLGFNVKTLLAGLGVGGIAIALAVQNILGDLFASLTIVLDRPFVVGDTITVGDLVGTVEKVGLKTTRVRSLSGEELIFPNSDLLQSRLRNYKRMTERRILFRFGVLYDTAPELLKKIPQLVKEVVEEDSRTRFDRAHFASMGNSSLDFEVVYYVLSPEYAVYMDIHQEINLKLFERVQKLGAEFAFPTQTLNTGKPIRVTLAQS